MAPHSNTQLRLLAARLLQQSLHAKDHKTLIIRQLEILAVIDNAYIKNMAILSMGDIDWMSEAFLQMAGVFSQLELAMIRARVKSGMENAKSKGKRIERPATTKEDIPAVFFKHYAIFMEGKMNLTELARVCGLSRPTVYKYLKMVG